MAGLYNRDPIGRKITDFHAKAYQAVSKRLPGYKYREAFANNLLGGTNASKVLGYERYDRGKYKPENQANPWYGWGSAAAASTDRMRKRTASKTLLDDEKLGG